MQTEFEKILNTKNIKCVCKRCGSMQSHTTVYCPRCGQKYKFKPETLYGAVKTMAFRENTSKVFDLNPHYLAAIHGRKLSKIFNIEWDDAVNLFTKYITGKLEAEGWINEFPQHIK